MSYQPAPAAALLAETGAMQALLELLQHERACLASGDAAGCEALLDAKAARVNELSALARERYRQLEALGLPASEYGMQQWLAAAPPQAADDWQALMAVAREAHELNRVNGMMLGQLAAYNRQGLAALGIGGQGDALYGPGGQSDYRPTASARIIG